MKLYVGAQQKFIGCTDAEIYGIEVVSKYSTFHSDPGLNGAEEDEIYTLLDKPSCMMFLNQSRWSMHYTQ